MEIFPELLLLRMTKRMNSVLNMSGINYTERGLDYVSNSLRDGVDYRNIEELKNFFEKEKINIVLNCTAYVGGIQFGYKHPGEMFYNNLMMTLNFLDKISYLTQFVNILRDRGLFGGHKYWNSSLLHAMLSTARGVTPANIDLRLKEIKKLL